MEVEDFKSRLILIDSMDDLEWGWLDKVVINL